MNNKEGSSGMCGTTEVNEAGGQPAGEEGDGWNCSAVYFHEKYTGRTRDPDSKGQRGKMASLKFNWQMGFV